MKKGISFILFLGLLVLSTHTSIKAEELPLTFSSTISEYVAGKGFSTTIQVKNMTDLTGLQLKLTYDEASYQIVNDVRHNSLTRYNYESPGEVIISYADAAEPVTGDMNLFTLYFIALVDSNIGTERALLEVDLTFNNEFIKSDANHSLSYVDATFELGGNRRYHLGDINKDDVITTMDINMMQLYLAELITLCEFGVAAADISATGDLNMFDIIRVQEYIVGTRDSIIAP